MVALFPRQPLTRPVQEQLWSSESVARIDSLAGAPCASQLPLPQFDKKDSRPQPATGGAACADPMYVHLGDGPSWASDMGCRQEAQLMTNSTPETRSPRSHGSSDSLDSSWEPASEQPSWIHTSSDAGALDQLWQRRSAQEGRATNLREPRAWASKNHSYSAQRTVMTTDEVPTLVAIFRQLKTKEPTKVLKLRKLQHLGATCTNKVLRQHFEQLGPVDEVFVVHSQVKVANHGSGCTRCKPSGLGFVVMDRSEDVATALRLGGEMIIGGSPVALEPFSVVCQQD